MRGLRGLETVAVGAQLDVVAGGIGQRDGQETAKNGREKEKRQ